MYVCSAAVVEAEMEQAKARMRAHYEQVRGDGDVACVRLSSTGIQRRVASVVWSMTSKRAGGEQREAAIDAADREVAKSMGMSREIRMPCLLGWQVTATPCSGARRCALSWHDHARPSVDCVRNCLFVSFVLTHICVRSCAAAAVSEWTSNAPTSRPRAVTPDGETPYNIWRLTPCGPGEDGQGFVGGAMGEGTVAAATAGVEGHS
jgi:hypothetical protein